MSGFYRFPAIAKLDGATLEHQVTKVCCEACEALDAMRDCLWDYDTGTRREEMREADRTAYGMELMDVIHAAETALRMEFSDAEVDGLREAVEEKNRRRGYYGKDRDEK